MPSIRLYVPVPYHRGSLLSLPPAQSHYLLHVMRVREGDPIAVFNGKDGEWLAPVASATAKSVTLELQHQTTPQTPSADLWLVFAPIKNKVAIVVEKAVELGVRELHIVYTQRSVVRSTNPNKLRAHAIEAAEQSGRHDTPTLQEHPHIEALLAGWPSDRTLLYGDETGGGRNLKTLLPALPSAKYAVLIGPEGGFVEAEHRMLKQSKHVLPVSLGPRILRADTATIAALALVQAWVGDWHA